MIDGEREQPTEPRRGLSINILKSAGVAILIAAVCVLGYREFQRSSGPAYSITSPALEARPGIGNPPADVAGRATAEAAPSAANTEARPAGAAADQAASNTRGQVFDDIYRNRVWGTDARGAGTSGFGSTMAFTTVYRAFLQDFLAKNRIRSVVDAGCGDWQFSRSIDWTGIDYAGCDIVESVVREDQERYGAANVRFFRCDMVTTDLPAADLLIVKDVLQHLSFRDIQQFLKQLPKYKHVLIINDVDPVSFTTVNRDVETGGYRPLDMTHPPFDMQMNKLLAWHVGGYTKLVLHRAQ
jgi:SAM-dependent methyltransferase